MSESSDSKLPSPLYAIYTEVVMVERGYLPVYSSQWSSILDTLLQCMKPLRVGQSFLVVMRNAELETNFRVGIYRNAKRLQVHNKRVRYNVRVNPSDATQLIITRIR